MKTKDTITPKLGLYIHWPYCLSKCPYCDFNSHIDQNIDHEAWRSAYLLALKNQSADLLQRDLHSVYFGGGTPSLMAPTTVAAILERAAQDFNFVTDIEITLEANPTSVEAARLAEFRAAGINRLSLGVQALNDTDLRRLGRTHSAADALAAFATARATFERVSFDLIYARQDQTLDAWRKELNQALCEGSEHLSLYQLTLEPGTAFQRWFKAGQLHGLPSEDLSADMYEETVDICSKYGLLAYEVSNFARKGAQGRHNLNYWHAGDYLGIGPGAHGRITHGTTRIETINQRAPKPWLTAITNKQTPWEHVTWDMSAYFDEILMMGLRLHSGVLLSRLKKFTAFSALAEPISTLCANGFLEQTPTHLRATSRGRMVLDAVLRDLIA